MGMNTQILMKNLEIKFFPQKELPIISVRQVARRVGQENLFYTQKFQNLTNFSPNSLKFGLKVLHHALCWAKEASAKI